MDFDLRTLGLADGDYEITVVARADGYLPSPPSNAVDYVVGGETLSAGLYDANDTLVASWDSLVNDYGMDCTIDYTSLDYNVETTCPYYVLTNNNDLANGVKLVIGNDIAKIGNYAFNFCSSLTSVTISNSVTTIGNYVFRNCFSLTSIEIPDSVTSIGSSAFRYCSSLTSIEIPDSVTSIGSEAFSSCKSLETIKIPDSVTSIGSNVFEYCTSLETIYCEVESKPNGWGSSWIGYNCPATVIWGYKPLITFTIAGNEYQAENGMTWGEWCESEYNTGAFYVDSAYTNGFIRESDGTFLYYDTSRVIGTDTIINGGNYSISHSG